MSLYIFLELKACEDWKEIRIAEHKKVWKTRYIRISLIGLQLGLQTSDNTTASWKPFARYFIQLPKHLQRRGDKSTGKGYKMRILYSLRRNKKQKEQQSTPLQYSKYISIEFSTEWLNVCPLVNADSAVLFLVSLLNSLVESSAWGLSLWH